VASSHRSMRTAKLGAVSVKRETGPDVDASGYLHVAQVQIFRERLHALQWELTAHREALRIVRMEGVELGAGAGSRRESLCADSLRLSERCAALSQEWAILSDR
jgi:hypothetical protein